MTSLIEPLPCRDSSPKGATHYFIGSLNPWRDLSSKDWLWWQEGRWHSPHEVKHADLLYDLDLSSAGLLKRNPEHLVSLERLP
ncbi:hypothetical protein Q6A49_12675 [Pseudomonas sp. 22-AL-CL-001]|uniref:hypothetical protein n=1 Tax=Pseudomonas alabamensis TaxID=3064349 RepID=UPI0027143A55|nr:hypothetical protein [Pseudomonas sp. 22-AL-CL-001]MDO7911388.1 hypothetical protein [Pseudomonas sp. 22-AL-CL-001]